MINPSPATWVRLATLLATLSLLPTAIAQAPRPAIEGVSHISVYTSNPTAAEHFYVHDLGAQKLPDPENPKGVRYYFNPTQFVEVLPLPEGYTSKSRLDHVAFNTSDAEALRSYLATHKITVPASVQRGSDGSQWFEVKDPENNRVQFVQPPTHPPTIAPNPLTHRIIHVGYIVHSAQLEDTFYHDILGFRPYWRGGNNENVPSWISSQVPNGSDWIEYMMATGPETTGVPANMSADAAGVNNHFALGIHNAEEAENLLFNEKRLNTKHSDPKIGADAKWQINLYDPDGTRAELMEFQPIGKPCCSPFQADSPKE
jgi:catechol 2,3-dioxygenase-like lactoylglutathione lyase family enzyme